MQITLLKYKNNKIQKFEWGAGQIALLTIAAIAVLATAVFAGYQGAYHQYQSQWVSSEAIETWKSELVEQKTALEQARIQSQQELDALTARLGLMQAHIRRLDAAGEQIATVAGLDVEQFSFSEVPALGGPEAGADDGYQVNYTISSLEQEMRALEGELTAREEQLDVLESLLLDKTVNAEQRIAGRPILSGWLSSPFGNRTDPFNGKKAWHNGVDFGVSHEGADVVATGTGVVTYVGKRSGYGKLVEISHGDGLITRYAHNKEIIVKKGDMVRRTQVIAKAGATGRSTGPHVHYEVIKNGRALNPYKYIVRK